MFLNNRIDARLRNDEVKIILMIIKKNPEKYSNESHFVRSAVIKLIEKETGSK